VIEIEKSVFYNQKWRMICMYKPRKMYAEVIDNVLIEGRIEKIGVQKFVQRSSRKGRKKIP